MRTPTEKQYRQLLVFASGAAGLSRTKRDTDPLQRRGWVTAEWDGRFYQWVRITPDGLRAVADAVERYGLPDLGPCKDPPPPDPPQLVQLREARDKAREEAHAAQASERRLHVRLTRAKRALEDVEALW